MDSIDSVPDKHLETAIMWVREAARQNVSDERRHAFAVARVQSTLKVEARVARNLVRLAQKRGDKVEPPPAAAPVQESPAQALLHAANGTAPVLPADEPALPGEDAPAVKPAEAEKPSKKKPAGKKKRGELTTRARRA